MSALAELQIRIQSTKSLIAEHEKALADPKRTDPGILPNNIRALEKLSKRLEHEFSEVAQSEEREVYRYWLLEPDDRPTAIAGVGAAWVKFEAFFREVYAAISKSDRPAKKKGKKAEDRSESAPILGYAYAFDRSIGVVMTAPREFLDFAGNSPLDSTSMAVFDFIESKNIPALSKRLGPGPVKALADLVTVHVENKFGIGLEWENRNGTRRTIEIQYQGLVSLREEISNVSTDTELSASGELYSVNSDTGRFGFRSDDDTIYEGESGGVISPEHAASVPARYDVKIRKSSKIVGTESGVKDTHTLVQLMALPIMHRPVGGTTDGDPRESDP